MSAQLHPQYVTDDAGERVSVILPIGECMALLEELEDLAAWPTDARKAAFPTRSLSLA
jgi:hypothetical protein